MRYKLLKRIFIMLLLIMVGFTITYVITHGVLESTYINEKQISTKTVNDIKARYGLEKPPIYEIYFRKLTKVLNSDIGMSWNFVNGEASYFIMLTIVGGFLLTLLFIFKVRKKRLK